jgi:hypothetical protein
MKHPPTIKSLLALCTSQVMLSFVMMGQSTSEVAESTFERHPGPVKNARLI